MFIHITFNQINLKEEGIKKLIDKIINDVNKYGFDDITHSFEDCDGRISFYTNDHISSISFVKQYINEYRVKLNSFKEDYMMRIEIN